MNEPYQVVLPGGGWLRTEVSDLTESGYRTEEVLAWELTFRGDDEDWRVDVRAIYLTVDDDDDHAGVETYALDNDAAVYWHVDPREPPPWVLNAAARRHDSPGSLRFEMNPAARPER